MDRPNRMAGEILGSHDELLSNQVLHYSRGLLTTTMDTVALEAPLTVSLNGLQAATVMRSPGADRDLALGLLVTSGRLPRDLDRAGLRFCERENAVHVRTDDRAWNEPDAARPGTAPPDLNELARGLIAMRMVLEERQRLHRHTGATHCAMFFDPEGSPLAFGEDVGRHNAFDKCVGNALRQGQLDKTRHAVITSRLGHEIVSKAIRARVGVLAGFSVATSMALEMAREHGITLVGRLRAETMIIYE